MLFRRGVKNFADTMPFYRHIYFRGPCRLEPAGLFNNGADQGTGTRWINPYCERFFSGVLWFSPLLTKFQFDQESGRRRTTLWMCYLQIIIVILLFFFIYTTEPRLFASTDVIVHMNSDIYETAFFLQESAFRPHETSWPVHSSAAYSWEKYLVSKISRSV